MNQGYRQDVLTKVQQTEMEIFKDFDALCEKYHLDYFGGGGTAIGAVRHHGFIPWDDDIDVGMLRKDYEKFKKVAAKEYPEKYKLVDFEHDRTWAGMNLHWEKVGTVFDDEPAKPGRKQRGIFLDIFCYDYLADDDKKMKRQAFLAWFWGKILILSVVKEPVLYQKGWKKKFILFICKIGHFFLRLFHIKRTWLYKKAKGYSTMYNGQKTNRVSFMFDPQPYTSIMKMEDIFPTIRIPYEDTTMKFPKNVEQYLEDRFGDYMKLPPEEDRHNHAPRYISFGEEKENEVS